MNTDPSLIARAARNFPDSPTLQHLWLKAVALVRSTSRGWLLDKPIDRRV